MTSSELRREYLKAFPWCQLSRVAAGRFGFPPQPPGRLCVHHLVGRGRDAEHWTNYISISPAAHKFAHGEHSAAARIALFWLKWKLSRQDARHWDVDVLRQVWGRDPIGWTENKLDTVELPPWVRALGRELVEGNGE